MIGLTNASTSGGEGQTKEITITANGDRTVSPDSGKFLNLVKIKTQVPSSSPCKPEEEKTVTAVFNGTTVVTPSPGKTIAKVTVITKVPSGGDGNINMDVQGYSSIDSLPSTVAENTIGVITSVPVSRWAVSGVQPDSPTEGMVWLMYDTGADIKIESEGGKIILLIGNAQQYISGRWESKERKVFQNGAWVGVNADIVPLFDNGDECNSATGGWVAYGKAKKAISGGTMTLSIPSSSSSGIGIVKTAREVDLSNVSRLRVYVSALDVSFGNTAELQVQNGGSMPQYKALTLGWNAIAVSGSAATIGFKLSRASGRNTSVSISNADGKPGIYLE